jgi:hypothetical protein
MERTELRFSKAGESIPIVWGKRIKLITGAMSHFGVRTINDLVRCDMLKLVLKALKRRSPALSKSTCSQS